MALSPRNRTRLYALLSVVMAGYLVMSWIITSSAADNRLCEGVLITVHDTTDNHFVTPRELAAELGDIPQTIKSRRIVSVDLDSIEKMLNLFDKIEHVDVNMLSSGKLLVDVWPMRPVARIFDDGGQSYYINRAGKRIAAQPGYFMDVPVIRGEFSPDFPATSLLPLLDYLKANPQWDEVVTMIEVRSPNDILLVPPVSGHVINLGDTTNLPDKFSRLKLMYSKVMATKGWDFYKEISVKWRGQIVGVRAKAPQQQADYIIEESNEEEAGTESADTDAGNPVKADKPIPAVAAKSKSDKPATSDKSERSDKSDRSDKPDKPRKPSKETKKTTT